MAHIIQESSTQDTSLTASTSSHPHDDIKECNNIRPPQKAFDRKACAHPTRKSGDKQAGSLGK